MYGLRRETLDSLVLELLPPVDHTYKVMETPKAVAASSRLEPASVVDDPLEVAVHLFQEILNALRNNAGFHIPRVNMPYSS